MSGVPASSAATATATGTGTRSISPPHNIGGIGEEGRSAQAVTYPRHRNLLRRPTSQYWGHGQRGSVCPSSHIPSSPVLPVCASGQAYVVSVASCRSPARKMVRRAACAGPAGFECRRLRRAFVGEVAAASTVSTVSPAVVAPPVVPTAEVAVAPSAYVVSVASGRVTARKAVRRAACAGGLMSDDTKETAVW